MQPYLKSPHAIYASSFSIIRQEADFSRLSHAEAHVAERVIHSCGMTEAADDLVFSPSAAEAGRAAIVAGAPVICDAEMVRHGVIQRLLPKQNQVLCLLSDQRVAKLALEHETTRSAAQCELWKDGMGDAVIAIGNAPTALFRLLELLDKGAPKPALILGFPVGFVGAAESKAELIANSRGVPFIALKGRRGGSAMAAAAVNALAIGWGA
jgi:precorrin-8X/cobalt-precorrin-8 methylmutase